MAIEEPLKIHWQERCKECGDISRALDRYDVEYESTYAAPEIPFIDAATNGNDAWAADPVVVDPDKPSQSIVGHEAVLEWIENRFGDD